MRSTTRSRWPTRSTWPSPGTKVVDDVRRQVRQGTQTTTATSAKGLSQEDPRSAGPGIENLTGRQLARLDAALGGDPGGEVTLAW